MPRAHHGDVDLFYDAAGDGETVIFCGDVGLGAWVWSWQAPALAGPFETVVWDLRGTGRSDAPSGPYEVTDLAGDLEAVLAHLGRRSAHVVGAGLGGMVALEYARSYGRASSLALMGTAAHGDAIHTAGLRSDPTDLDALLSHAFRTTYPEAVERIIVWQEAEDAGDAAGAAQAAAARAFDVRDHLPEITVPTLVMHGTADAVVPVEAGETLATELPRGRLDRFENGTHLFFVEQSTLATDALFGFLE